MRPHDLSNEQTHVIYHRIETRSLYVADEVYLLIVCWHEISNDLQIWLPTITLNIYDNDMIIIVVKIERLKCR